MPLWFRFALGAMFAVLLVPFALLHSSAGKTAVAHALARSFGVDVAPLLTAQAVLPGRFELPADGSYSINGMPVEYHTYPVRESAASILARFQSAFERTGFEVKLVPTAGSPTLVGVHPETKMMLTARPVRDTAGKAGIRVTEQDLSRLDPGFDTSLPGVPVYPGAGQRILISSIEGRRSQSLSYFADGSVEMVEQYFREEMKSAGWQRHDPPVRLPPGSPVTLFFENGRLESSVLIVPQPGSSGVFVMATLTGDPEELS